MSRKIIVGLFAFVLSTPRALSGQENRMAIVGFGYVVPLPVSVAPGQVLTLFVHGAGVANQNMRASEPADLPVSLAGFRVRMSLPNPPLAVVRLPIAAVTFVRACDSSVIEVFGPCSRLVAITVQIPYEVKPNRIRGSMRVSSEDIPGYDMDITVYDDQIHILQVYDVAAPELSRQVAICQGRTTLHQSPHNFIGLPCPSLITHADGSLVTADSPATAGEVLVAYGVGLGQTSPPSETGKLVVTSAPTQMEFTLDFNYRPNALATKPRPPSEGAPRPLYTGTTPGYVGLYQINFVVPAVPPGTRPA